MARGFWDFDLLGFTGPQYAGFDNWRNNDWEPAHPGVTFNWRDHYQDVPPNIMAGVLAYRCGEYMFVVTNRRYHYNVVPTPNQPPVVDFASRTWGLVFSPSSYGIYPNDLPSQFWPWPREGDGPFEQDELPYFVPGTSSVSDVVQHMREREARARRELDNTMGPLLNDVQSKISNTGSLLEGARLAMEGCAPIFERESWWRMLDSGLSTAFDMLAMMYGAGLAGRVGKFAMAGQDAWDFGRSAASGDVLGAGLSALGLSEIKSFGKGFRTINGLVDARRGYTVPRTAGSGGANQFWKTINEVPDPNFKQLTENAFAPTCAAELLKGGNVKGVMPSDLAKAQGSVSTPYAGTKLVDAMNAAEGKAIWQSGHYNVTSNSSAKFDRFNEQGPFGTTLMAPGMGKGHMVIVEGKNNAGRVVIRDPDPGIRYEMEWDAFVKVWEGFTIWRK